MGGLCSFCQESNPHFTAKAGSLESDSEKAISMSEKKFTISKVSSTNIRKSISSQSANGSLTFKGIQRTSNELGFDSNELKKPDSSLSHFFNSFINQSQDYDERQFLLAGILISSSSVKEKSTNLFEIYDLNKNGLLKKSEISRLLEESFFVSVECLPKLAQSHGGNIDEGIRRYLDQIRPHQDQFVSEALEVIMKKQPEIGKERFCEVYLNEAEHLSNSSGIRTYVFSKFGNKTSQ
jgi:Ca2+-binding EF-hand superfamily protein